MADKNPVQKKDPKKKNPIEHQHTEDAFEQAEEDIEKDITLQPDENEDLDEGELARKEGHP